MTAIGTQPEPESPGPSPSGRPGIEGLLLHPIRKSDNGDDAAPRAGLDPSDADEDHGDESYKNWVVHHARQARFYVGGLESVTSITGFGQAKRYYAYVERASQIALEESWSKAIDGSWTQPISYNQFLKAFNSNKPMFFDIAARILVACECAVEDAIEEKRYAGGKLDVYSRAKIVPACFNIDEFDLATLNTLRENIVNYDSEVLRAAGQRNPHLLEALAKGECVTRPTARAIRKRTVELLQSRPIADIEIGDVRGRPGRQQLGRGRATTFERVELEDLGKY
jgi:hypothetical protein